LFTLRSIDELPDENLLREKRKNEAKHKFGVQLVKEIKYCRNMALKDQKNPNIKKVQVQTTLPYFDIEYRTILKIIVKNFDKDLDEVPKNKELLLLNKHIFVFERLFGFKFGENKSLSAITNQSYIGLDIIYPEIKDSTDENKLKELQLDKNHSTKVNFYVERENMKKKFHIFTEPSTVINDAQSFVVSLLDQ